MNLKEWPYSGTVNGTALSKAIRLNKEKLKIKGYDRYLTAIKDTKSLAQKIRRKLKDNPKAFTVKNGIVKIGADLEISPSESKLLSKSIQKMLPWRKGPFDLLGQNIDAEWRSDYKWDRIKKHLGPLQGKTILDIGCNNGYFMYHMAKQKPRYLLGIDPVIPYQCQFDFLNQFSPLPNTDFKLLGVDDLVHFEKVFDVVFCMGILYHHPDPFGILKNMYNSMRYGGLIIIECQGIHKDGPFMLFPRSRYLNAPGHWFLPSKEALENIIRRSGFQYVDTFFETKLSDDEQRSSQHAPYDSLKEALDPNNPDLTVEGYPAPWRFYVKARKVRVRR